MRRLLFVLVTGCGLCVAPRLQADLALALGSAVQNGAQGTELVFNATLTNTSATDKVFLNDIQPTLNGTSTGNLALEPNTFFANVPGILLPGEVYSGIVFRLALSASAPPSDYTGTINVLGGADIFATATLASGTVTVLSPALTLSATTPDAYEVGPVAGGFTVTRTGRTDIDLPVSLVISGTGANGADYQAISPTVTIPSGSSSAIIAITPIPDDRAEGDRSITLTVTASSLYNLGAPSADTVTLHDKPADNWRWQEFGALANTAAASDTASWSGDGIPNLIKYALNLDPKTSATLLLPAPVLASGYLTLSYLPNPAATDATITVESSANLAAWSSTDVENITPSNPNPPGLVTFRYKYPVTGTSEAFLRVTVGKLNP